MVSCTSPPLENSPFCAKHQQYCPIKSPLSGSEPEYNPARYNKYKGIKESHNCFAYAFNYLKMPTKKQCTKNSCPVSFPQPGLASGYPKWSKVKGKKCADLWGRLYGDVPGIKRTTFTAKCPKGTYKISPVADEDQDYHFYRKDNNGYWSHKPGATSVTHLDATKRPIYNPELASRYYPDSGLNYDRFCGYACVPATQAHKFKRGGHFSKKRAKTIKFNGGHFSKKRAKTIKFNGGRRLRNKTNKLARRSK
jgi:hypothetical protein